MSRPRPKVAIIGAGRVGQALGLRLREAGYPIGTVVCRTAAAARNAVAFVGGGTAWTMRRLREIEGDVVIVATPDAAIAGTAEALASLPVAFGGRVVLHVSGSLSASALGALKARGAATGSCHPLQSFATPELGWSRISGSAFAIEGDRTAVAAATRLVRDVGGRPVRLAARARSLYHAAAVMASGHVTAIIDASLEAMRAAGLGEQEALDAVLPLVEGTIGNIRSRGTRGALTGPFARGDDATIERNRAALMEVSEELARLYDELGARSRVIARRSST